LEKKQSEHNREMESGREGEESGTEFGLDDRCDEVRNGARLILSYEKESDSFNGTVENTTNEILKRVRVEVHLSNGMEIGPTVPTDLKPGEKRAVNLVASNKDFESWSAHAEVGTSEHNTSGEGEEDHDHDSQSEEK